LPLSASVVSLALTACPNKLGTGLKFCGTMAGRK
jgi:hypothetical protein